MSDYLMGIDIGTSVIKSSIYDTFGGEKITTSEKVQVLHPKPDYSELSMETVWDKAVLTIRNCLQYGGVDPKRIAAVGCCGQGDGLWRLDNSGEAVEPAILWNDNRGKDVIREWKQRGVLSAYFPKNGNVLWAGCTGALLKWMLENDQEDYARIKTVFNAKDWVNYRLTGIIATDETDASIPFMDLKRRTYDRELSVLLGLPGAVDLLAPIGRSTDILGRVNKEAAARTGLIPGTPVVHGLLDVTANAVGADVTRDGQSFMILGTTLLSAVVSKSPIFPPMDVGFSLCGAFPNQWLRLLGSETGTPNLDWLIREFGAIVETQGEEDPFIALESLAADSTVGSGGVIYHPFINGERAPFLNPDASSAFFGIREHTTRSEIVRAVFEGSGLCARHGLESLGRTVEQIVVTGGGAKNNLWCQIIADAARCRVRVPSVREFGTCGAARIAGIGIGSIGESDRFGGESSEEDVKRVFNPVEANSDRYDQLYRHYVDLIDRLESFWCKHAELLEEWDH